MIISMKIGASKDRVKKVISAVKAKGFEAKEIQGEERMVIAVIGKVDYDDEFINHISFLPGVDMAQRITVPYKLAAKEYGNGHKVKVNNGKGDLVFGGDKIFFMAGPCTVEGKKPVEQAAKFLSNLGVKFLRAGAFKPRTNPRCFEGLGEEGLEILAEVGEKHGMLIITEFLDPRHYELFEKYKIDVIQIGTSNMGNAGLLRAAGSLNKPVLLKRNKSAKITEFLGAAGYILDEQDEMSVILCERGIRTFEDEKILRNNLDINAIPVVKSLSWLPIVVDPSHATGKSAYVPSVTLAGIAGGADGILIEVHPEPKNAKIDGMQSLDFKVFEKLYNQAKRVAQAIGRTVI